MSFHIPWWIYIALGFGLGVSAVIPVTLFAVLWVARPTKAELEEERRATERKGKNA